jgi:molecular chaperone GrpE
VSDPNQPEEPAATAAADQPAEAPAAEAELFEEAAAEPNLDEALREASEQVLNYKDAMLRMQAEMENLRKRMSRDLDRSRKLALEGIMNDLLPVRDSLERGLEAAEEGGTMEALREGKALTMKMLGKVMHDHGLEIIDPRGEAFNPELHEALSMLPSDEHPANTVMDVIQKGYRLHERLIRPARVVVSRGPAGD